MCLSSVLKITHIPQHGRRHLEITGINVTMRNMHSSVKGLVSVKTRRFTDREENLIKPKTLRRVDIEMRINSAVNHMKATYTNTGDTQERLPFGSEDQVTVVISKYAVLSYFFDLDPLL